MTTTQLIAHAKGDDATELELELADRLVSAVAEIDTLVSEIATLRAALETPDGQDA